MGTLLGTETTEDFRALIRNSLPKARYIINLGNYILLDPIYLDNDILVGTKDNKGAIAPLFLVNHLY